MAGVIVYFRQRQIAWVRWGKKKRGQGSSSIERASGEGGKGEQKGWVVQRDKAEHDGQGEQEETNKGSGETRTDKNRRVR